MPLWAFGSIRRSGSMAAAALVAAAALWMAGCDAADSATHKADLQVEQQTNKANMAMDTDPAAAHTALDAAAKQTTASLDVQARAKASLADAELEMAQGLARLIANREARIGQLTMQISDLTDKINANNNAAVNLAKFDPAKVKDAISSKSSDETGSDSKPDFYKSDTGLPLASLSSVDKQTAAFQQQIDQLKAKIQSETDQRTQLLNNADKLTEQSEREDRAKSLELYTNASDSRKQAADLTVQIDQDNVLLTRAQQDLAGTTAQHETLQGSIKVLADRGTTVDAQWKTISDQVDALNAASKAILGDDVPALPEVTDKANEDLPAGDTISAKTALLTALVKKNHSDRDAAVLHLTNAITFYREANEAASKFKNELAARVSTIDPQKTEHTLWQEQVKTMDPNQFKFLQGDAQLQEAELFARQAGELKSRVDLSNMVKTALDAAKLAAPTDLSDSALDSELKTAQDKARDLFNQAKDTLGNVADGAAPAEIKAGAYGDLIYAHYGLSLLEDSAGDATKAGTELEAARAAASAAANNVYLPGLPADVAPAGGAAPGAPGAPGTPVR